MDSEKLISFGDLVDDGVCSEQGMSFNDLARHGLKDAIHIAECICDQIRASVDQQKKERKYGRC